MAKGQLYCLKSCLGTRLIPIVVKGQTLGNGRYKIEIHECEKTID